MEIRQHRCLGDARVDDDQRRVGIRTQAPAQNRVVLRDVGADEDDHVGLFEVFIRAGRTVAAERTLVAGHRGGHAQRGVAVDVGRTDAELHQLAERVELLRHELTGADDAHRARPVLRLRLAKLRRHRREGFVPADAAELTVALEQRVTRAVVGDDGVMLREPLRAEHAAVDRMIRVAAHRHRAVALDADEHPASHRAVAARRRHPLVRHLLRGDVPGNLIDRVGVAVSSRVESEESLERHEASLADAM